MRAALLLLLCLATAVACSRLAAEEKKAPEKLSLADAISSAIDINANLKRAEEGRVSSQSRLRVAGITTSLGIGTIANLEHTPSDSGRSGRLFGELSYKNPLGTELTLNLSPFGIGSERGAVGMSLRHPLMQGKGALSAKADALQGARSDETIQEKQLYITRQTTVQGVIEAYYRAVQAREQVKVQEEALEIAQKAAEGAEKKLKWQVVTKIEASRAEIQVAQTQDRLNTQRQSARGAIDNLMVAIGAGVGQAPELTDSVPEVDTQLPPLGETIDKALANRAELSVYNTQLSEQTRKLAMRDDKLRPSLDIVAGFNSTSPDAGLISRSLYDLGSLVSGVEYRLPIDRRAALEDRDTTARDLDVMRRMRVYEMERIAQEVRNSYRSFEASKSSVKILGDNLQTAQQNYNIADRMVKEGLDDNRNLLEAQRSLTETQTGLLSAKVDLYLAWINLKYAMGEDITTIGRK